MVETLALSHRDRDWIARRTLSCQKSLGKRCLAYYFSLVSQGSKSYNGCISLSEGWFILSEIRRFAS